MEPTRHLEAVFLGPDLRVTDYWLPRANLKLERIGGDIVSPMITAAKALLRELFDQRAKPSRIFETAAAEIGLRLRRGSRIADFEVGEDGDIAVVLHGHEVEQARAIDLGLSLAAEVRTVVTYLNHLPTQHRGDAAVQLI